MAQRIPGNGPDEERSATSGSARVVLRERPSVVQNQGPRPPVVSSERRRVQVWWKRSRLRRQSRLRRPRQSESPAAASRVHIRLRCPRRRLRKHQTVELCCRGAHLSGSSCAPLEYCEALPDVEFASRIIGKISAG